MNPNSLKVVLKMRDLLADPDHWIKGEVAQNAKGHNTSALAAEACKFCLIGAYSRALFEVGIDPFAEAQADFNIWKEVFEFRRDFMPASFNDDPHTTHADVLKLIDERIAECSAPNSSAQ